MAVTINSNASGVWAIREGQEVVVVGLKPNGMAAGVRFPDDGPKTVRWVPTRWLDGYEPPRNEEPVPDPTTQKQPKKPLKAEVKAVIGTEYCPHCGQLIPKESK